MTQSTHAESLTLSEWQYGKAGVRLYMLRYHTVPFPLCSTLGLCCTFSIALLLLLPLSQINYHRCMAEPQTHNVPVGLCLWAKGTSFQLAWGKWKKHSDKDSLAFTCAFVLLSYALFDKKANNTFGLHAADTDVNGSLEITNACSYL